MFYKSANNQNHPNYKWYKFRKCINFIIIINNITSQY